MVPADVQRGGYLRVGSGAERNVVKIFDEVGEAADVFMPTRLPRRKLNRRESEVAAPSRRKRSLKGYGTWRY